METRSATELSLHSWRRAEPKDLAFVNILAFSAALHGVVMMACLLEPVELRPLAVLHAVERICMCLCYAEPPTRLHFQHEVAGVIPPSTAVRHEAMVNLELIRDALDACYDRVPVWEEHEASFAWKNGRVSAQGDLPPAIAACLADALRSTELTHSRRHRVEIASNVSLHPTCPELVPCGSRRRVFD